MTDTLLNNCSDAHFLRFAEILLRHYEDPQAVEADEAFSLMDTVLNVPVERLGGKDRSKLVRFARWWLENGGDSQKAAALRLFRHLIPTMTEDDPEWEVIVEATQQADCAGCTPLLFLQAQLSRRLGLDASAYWEVLDQPEPVSGVFLDNLKTAPEGRRGPAFLGRRPDPGPPE